MTTTRLYPIWRQPRARPILGVSLSVLAVAGFAGGWMISPDSAVSETRSDQQNRIEQRQCAWGHDAPDGCTAWVIYDPDHSPTWRVEVWMGETPPQVGGGPWWQIIPLSEQEAYEALCPPGQEDTCRPITIGPRSGRVIRGP